MVGAASLLYGVLLAAIGGRVVLRKYPPNTESQAFVLGVGALVVMAIVYGVLNAIFWLLHLPSGFGG